MFYHLPWCPLCSLCHLSYSPLCSLCHQCWWSRWLLSTQVPCLFSSFVLQPPMFSLSSVLVVPLVYYPPRCPVCSLYHLSLCPIGLSYVWRPLRSDICPDVPSPVSIARLCFPAAIFAICSDAHSGFLVFLILSPFSLSSVFRASSVCSKYHLSSCVLCALYHLIIGGCCT